MKIEKINSLITSVTILNVKKFRNQNNHTKNTYVTMIFVKYIEINHVLFPFLVETRKKKNALKAC